MTARPNAKQHSGRQTRRHPSAGRRLLAAVMPLESRRLLAAFTVNADPEAAGPGVYTNIADAVVAAGQTAETDDTITLTAGSYTENVELNTPVSLLGPQTGEASVVGQIAITSTGVSVDGISVHDGAAGLSAPAIVGIYITAPDASVTNVHLVGNNAGTAILAASSDPAATATLSSNQISGWTTGIALQMTGASTVDHNEIDENGVGLSIVSSASTSTINDNSVTSSSAAGIAVDLTATGAGQVTIRDNSFDNEGVPQLKLDGGTEGEDQVTLQGNSFVLDATTTYINLAAPTPLAGRSDNTFSLFYTTEEGQTLDIDVAQIDGSNATNLTTSSLAGTASANQTIIAVTPETNFNGTTSLGFETELGATGAITLTVTPVNDAPTAHTIPPQSMLEEETKTIDLSTIFSDVDVGDTLTYSLAGTVPSFVSIDANTGLVTIAPHTGDRGQYSFTASASDGQASSPDATISLEVIRALNNAPVIGNLPDTVTLAENALVPVFDVDATDPDGDSVTYSIVGGDSAGRFAIDPNTGAITLVQALDAEEAQSYTLTIRATDDGDPAPASSEAALTVNVTDVNDVETTVTLEGPSTSVQGETVTYVAHPVDADIDHAFTYRWLLDGVEQTETSDTFSTSFTYEGDHVIRVEVSDRGAAAGFAVAGLSVGDAPPLIPLSTSVSTVDEGRSFSLIIGAVTDANPADMMNIGQVAIEWGDGQLLVINADTDAASLEAIRNGTPIQIPHTYDDGKNADRTISVHLYNTDGQTFTAWQPILVNNVAPTGTLTAVTPTVAVGSVAVVNWFGQTDVSSADRLAGLRYTFAIDTNANGALDSGDTLISGDGTYAGSGGISQVTIAGSLLPTTGTYKILGVLIDKDNAPVLTKSVDVVVTAGTLRVVSIGGDHSGFTVNFNRPVDRSVINLWDGTDAANDTPDVVLQRANNQVVTGTLVWNAAGTGFDFLVTGGILQAGNYTVTIRSGALAFHGLDGSALDGDDNGTAGGTYTQIFGVNAPPGPVLSAPDFARGPGQPIDVIPGTASSDLPITMSTPITVTSLDFQIRYNANLMDVQNVYAGSGLPAGWDVAWTLGANVINVSLTKNNPSALDMPAGVRELIKLQASVPNNPAIYGQSQIISFASIVVNGNAFLEGTADRSLHKVIYLGDANLDGNVNAADAALIQSIVLRSVTGFDTYPLVDPMILVDSSRNFLVDSQDATNAALSGFTGGRPTEVPAFTPLSLPGTIGADPTFSIGTIRTSAGATITVPISVTDNALGIQAGVIRISYDPAVLTLLNSPVLAGNLLDANWKILSNVNANEGWIEIAFYNGSALAGTSPLTGTLLNLQFAVDASAGDLVSPITISAPHSGSTSPTAFYDRGGVHLATNAVSGAIVIDTVPPAAQTPVFNFAGTRQTITVVFSEDVRNSIVAGNFELKNLNTGQLVQLVVDSISADGKTATFRFANTGGITGAILTDGNYRFRVLPNTIADGSGNVNTAGAEATFFFMNADANHDGTVSFNDLVTLAQNYNHTGMTFANGDFNYDGKVDFTDLVILAGRYNKTLPAVPPPPAPLVATADKKRSSALGTQSIVR